MAVNYQMDVINPFQAALQGYGAGAQILQQERTAERQVRQDEQQGQLFGLQMQEAQARLQTLSDERAKAQRAQASMAKALEAVQNGEFSSELIAETYMASPEFGKFLQAERDRLSTEQKRNLASQNIEIATAIEMNQIPIAKQLYEEMAVAAENSDKPEDAAAARALAAQLDTPDGRDVVKTTAYMAAGSVLPPQDFNQTYANIQAMKGEKETEAVRTARTYAATFGPPGSPEYIRAFRTKMMPPPAPGTTVIVGGEGKPLTPGQKKVDENFAETYAAFVTGGATDTAKQVAQLSGALKELETNKELTGPLIGMMPDALQSIAAPASLAVKQTIQEVVQRNLRAVLGPAFTAKEGEALIARAFDPTLGQQENVKRVRRLLEQIERANADTEAAVRFYEDNGSLQGFKYKAPRLSDFEDAASGKGPPAGIDFSKLDNTALLRQDVGKMTREQRNALTAELDKRGL